MQELKLSIIVPVYNVEEYIEECYYSIESQTYKNVEIIFVDDGSTDKSGKICDTFKLKNSKVKVYHKKNGGLSDARNYGLKKSNGDYILYIDSDDFLMYNTALQNMMDILNYRKLDMIMFNHSLYYEKTGKIVQKKMDVPINYTLFKDIFEFCTRKGEFPVSACGKVIKADIAKKIQFKLGYLSEDVEWFCRLAQVVNTCVFFNKNPYVYRQRANSITTSPNIKQLEDLMEYVENVPKTIVDGMEASVYSNIMSGLAYEYVQCIGGLSSHRNNEKYRDLYLRIKANRQILKFDQNPKVRLSKIAIDILGIKGAGYLFAKKMKMVKDV